MKVRVNGINDEKLWREIIGRLSQQPNTPTVSNPYLQAHCRQNLLRYWQQQAVRQPRLLLIGEAPGHRGTARTGVPFTSERILANRALFDDGYQVKSEKPVAEATATIVWTLLAQLPVSVVLWNAFPWHPHRVDDPASNRKPNSAEILSGAPFIHTLIKQFEIETVGAIGKVAAALLHKIEIDHVAIRHPSYGGKVVFERGLRQLVNRETTKTPAADLESGQ